MHQQITRFWAVKDEVLRGGWAEKGKCYHTAEGNAGWAASQISTHTARVLCSDAFLSLSSSRSFLFLFSQ